VLSGDDRHEGTISPVSGLPEPGGPTPISGRVEVNAESTASPRSSDWERPVGAVMFGYLEQCLCVAEILTLRDAIGSLVSDGQTVALEGFTHLIPHAAGHEIVRQGRRDLTLVRMTPDVVYDQLIGAGCARKLVFSWGGNPGVGSLRRFRDAVENGWPVPLELEEHSHAGMAAAYAAGASNLPFAVLRGYRGTDLAGRSRVASIACPFTGEELSAVPSLRPDVGIVHAQQADRQGNVQLWGISGVQKEVVLASARSLVTVEEIVDELELRPGAVVLPGWAISEVALAPGGAHPSYAHGYYDRDNAFYVEWDAVSGDRERFEAWMERHVRSTAGIEEYHRSLAGSGARS
jgi:glutaconate CoA-transferase subunit A